MEPSMDALARVAARRTHGAAPSLPLPAGRPASIPAPHVPQVIAQQSNQHEGRRSASAMIGIVGGRSDPWHGRRWPLPPDADLRVLGSRGAGRWRRGRSTARPPTSAA
jgi:nucleotide-binding universal stress UspA family protein